MLHVGLGEAQLTAEPLMESTSEVLVGWKLGEDALVIDEFINESGDNVEDGDDVLKEEDVGVG
jgi:hypothetical protein